MVQLSDAVTRRSNFCQSRLWTFALLASATAVLVACGSETSGNQDSARLTDTPDTVRVDVPELVIGESASPDDDFMFPLAAGVDRTGNVYVFDAQTLDLRRFSSTGSAAYLIAKRGGGPGELTNPTSFLFDSVSVGVWEGRAGRYTVLSTTGEVIDEVNLGIVAPTRVTTVLQSTSAGEFFLANISEVPPHPDSIRGKDRVVFLRVSSGAPAYDTLYSYERPAASLSFHGGRTRAVDPGPRYGPVVLFDAEDPGFVRLDRPTPDRHGAADFTLQRIALNGTLLNHVRYTTSATAIPDHMRDSLAAIVDGLPLEIPESAPLQASWPAYYPPIAGMLLSKHDDGRIWLELPPSDPEGGSTWIILDRALQPLLHVRLPRRLQYPIAAGPYIAGTVEREDGTRVIHTYRVPGSPSSEARN